MMKIIVLTEDALFEIVWNMVGYAKAFPFVEEREYRENLSREVQKYKTEVLISKDESEMSRRRRRR